MKVVGRSKKGKGVKGKFGVRQGEKKRSEELAWAKKVCPGSRESQGQGSTWSRIRCNKVR